MAATATGSGVLYRLDGRHCTESKAEWQIYKQVHLPGYWSEK